MTEWRYSQLIFIERNNVYQQCTSYTSAVSKSVGNAFSGNLQTWILKKNLFTVYPGDTSWRLWTKKTKKTESFGENSYRRKCLDKSLFTEKIGGPLTGASLALVGNPSSDGVTMKMPYGVDVLHQPALHPIFSYWVG